MKKGSLTEHPTDTNLIDALLPEIRGGKGQMICILLKIKWLLRYVVQLKMSIFSLF